MARQSTTSERRLTSLTREQTALDLRRTGDSYREIARALGVSHQTAHRLVTRAMTRIVGQCEETAAEVRALELDRLDAMLAGLWPGATSGDHRAVGAVIKIMERRAAILGTDKPIKTAATTPEGDEIPTSGVVVVPAIAGSVEDWMASVEAWKTTKATTRANE